MSLLEIQLSLLSEPVLMPVAASAWGLYLESPLLRAIPLIDVRPTNAAVAYLGDCPDAYVHAFAQCAREVCEQSIELIPGGQVT